MAINNAGNALSINLCVRTLKSGAYFLEYFLYFKVNQMLDVKHPMRKLSIKAMR